MTLQKRLDELAILYNKTNNERYKKLWYKLIREAYGSDNTKRWNVHSSSSDKTNDERCNVIRPVKFFRSL